MYNKQYSGDYKIMKIVEDINRLILKKVVEIVFMVSFVFFATYLWRGKHSQNMLAAMNSFHNLSYTDLIVTDPIDYSMYPMTDEYAMQYLKPCLIQVINETYTHENYTLVLKINKKSSLDYHFLNLGLNEKVYSLKDLESKDTNDEIVFILARDSIVGEVKTYNIRLWLDSQTGNEMQAKNLIMNFDLINETTQV